MNTVKGVVTEVLSEPYKKHNYWMVKVEFNSYGSISERELMFDTKEEAENVTEGYEFLT